LFLRGRASVLDRVVSAKLKEAWEPLLSLLARVSTVPTCVHVGVEPVVEATLIVLQIDGLG